ncbi:interferon-induced protein with tetratricopeptide repeats 5-like [Ornithorhynchus anatinus]|uniref:Interferon induced protein with tetratricopeptide repeats 5 n=1 Tax=Ornithorhynchus anatinus TaxID=9258 RepID=A0A6I8N9J2_ORNAN|nr:interferon-induced protein with tetratricopeptide repeats 5-like [Ornithorhynchus anatinus]
MSEVAQNFLHTALQQLACHFTWDLKKEDITLDDLEDRISDQIEFLFTKSKFTSYNLLAYAKYLKGQNEEALESLRNAEEEIQMYSKGEAETRHLVIWGNRAWIHYHMGNLAKAQNYVDRVERMCSKLSSPHRYKVERPEIFCEEGWALLKFGGKHYERAKVCFEKALEQEPDNPEFNSGFAITVYRLDNLDRQNHFGKCFSLEPLRQAVRLNPGDSYVKVLLALKLQDLQKEAEGEKYIQETLDEHSSSPYVLRYAAKFYRRKGCVDTSLELLQKALKITPKSAFLNHQIGLCYRAQMIEIKQAANYKPQGTNKEKMKKLVRSAIFHFELTLEQRPNFIFAKIVLASMYAELGEHEKADDIFQKILQMEKMEDTDKQAAHLYYGRFQEFQMKSESNALIHYVKGLKITKDSEVNEKLKTLVQKIAKKRLRQNTSDSESLGLLGFVHQLQGEIKEAIDCYQKALKLDPTNDEYFSALCLLQLKIKAQAFD